MINYTRKKHIEKILKKCNNYNAFRLELIFTSIACYVYIITLIYGIYCIGKL